MRNDVHREIELQNERMREAAHQRALRRALAYTEQERRRQAHETALRELHATNPDQKSSLTP